VSDETPSAHAFFEQYARARSTRDVDLIASQYADPFMLADPNGARVVQKASLLAVFPNGLQLLRIQAIRLQTYGPLVKTGCRHRSALRS
jgi:ketosteroid isomerase-like protein